MIVNLTFETLFLQVKNMCHSNVFINIALLLSYI